MDTNQLATRLTSALSLDTPPVAVTFVEQPPADIPTTQAVVPSSCAFWRKAEEGTFYAPAAAHFNCPIGTMVMGFDMPQDVSDELGELMTKMCDCAYIDPAEASSIPTVPGQHSGIVYGPLAGHPTTPTVVLVWAAPRQAMLANEAVGTANWSHAAPHATGRPACAALPLAVSTGTPVTSFGCAGMRTFTEISDDRLLLAIPGDKITDFVDAVTTTAAINQQMDEFYQSRKTALAETTST